MNEIHRYRLDRMTYEDVRAIVDAGAYALLPCGATEAHGPHLPLATDVIIAETGALWAADVLSREKIRALVLPPVAYSVTEYASEFSGTISLSPETCRAFVRDCILGATRSGFLGVTICNAHLEPLHIETLRNAVADAIAAGAKASFPDVTKKPHALRLGEEFKSGACHAGRYETSLVLAADPFIVRQDVAIELPPNPTSLSRAIKDGKKTFLEAGGPRAYFGDPALATTAEGTVLYHEMADIFASGVRELHEEP
jgi:creatinine amidohydrolase